MRGVVCACSRFRNQRRKISTLKTSVGQEWDSGPMTREFENGHQAVIQGQGSFTKRGLPRVIPPEVGKGY